MTFEKEVTWTTFEFNNASGKSEEVKKTKVVTFHELDRHDKTQHKLHFKIISLFQGTKDSENEVEISSDAMYDLTVKAINQLLVISPDFTEMDKKELLYDSIAILNLAFWLFSEKFTPFFQQLK